MADAWREYFFMIGSSAAALIGLMFVVVTLTAGRDGQEIERGKRLYTSPIVWHLSAVLVVSAAAIAPAVPPQLFALACAALASLGVAIGLRSAIGILRRPGALDSAWFDVFWYGLAPAITYVALSAGALGMWNGAPWASQVVAAAVIALLLVSIHAEWDLVTFLAPIAGPRDPNRP